ncbi:hypothetical protein ABTC87_04905, partial [Acinetobacter baumannii]
MAPIDILFLFGFLGIWIPQAFWAWLSYQAWKYSKTAEKELQNLPIPERWPVLSVLIPAYSQTTLLFIQDSKKTRNNSSTESIN